MSKNHLQLLQNMRLALKAALLALAAALLTLALLPGRAAAETIPFYWLDTGSALALDDAGTRFLCVPDGAGEAALPLPNALRVSLAGEELPPGARAQLPAGVETALAVAYPEGEKTVYVTISRLPALTIEGGRINEYAARAGTAALYAPGEAVYASPITVKQRGGYSRLFTLKKNYAVHLKTADGGQEKQALLSLRRDDDWVLDGALNDPSRLRNRVALDIWNDIAGGAPRGELCEVFVSGYYKGVYCLNERPDRKSAGLDKADALCRTTAPAANGVNLLAFDGLAGAADEASWHNVELVYAPADADGFAKLRALYAFVCGADEDAFAREIGRHLDLPALADYYLFVNACAASDNMLKNLYIALPADAPMYFLPWDADASFGRLYTAEKSSPEEAYGNVLYDKLLRVPAFQALLRARWQALRPYFTPEAVAARFARYADILYENGAWAREKAKNPAYTDVTTNLETPFDIASELMYIASFAGQRLLWMDARFSR